MKQRRHIEGETTLPVSRKRRRQALVPIDGVFATLMSSSRFSSVGRSRHLDAYTRNGASNPFKVVRTVKYVGRLLPRHTWVEQPGNSKKRKNKAGRKHSSSRGREAGRDTQRDKETSCAFEKCARQRVCVCALDVCARVFFPQEF